MIGIIFSNKKVVGPNLCTNIFLFNISDNMAKTEKSLKISVITEFNYFWFINI